MSPFLPLSLFLQTAGRRWRLSYSIVKVRCCGAAQKLGAGKADASVLPVPAEARRWSLLAPSCPAARASPVGAWMTVVDASTGPRRRGRFSGSEFSGGQCFRGFEQEI